MTKPKGKTPSTSRSIQQVSRFHTEMLGEELHVPGCKKVISLGEKCFQIPKVKFWIYLSKTYCLNCFGQILGQTKSELFELEKMLNDQIEVSR